MANLKKPFVDPFQVNAEPAPVATTTAPPAPPPSPVPEVEVAPVPAAPKPARPRRPRATEAPPKDNGVGEGAEAELETLFARVPADVGDWLRELRWRHRVPAAALVRSLLQLAREDERLLQRAVDLAKNDSERPGPRRRAR